MAKRRVIIMGAAGRDFHNFNVYFRENKEYEVVAFTAAQIPNIEGRLYPPELAGPMYPKGISIHPEAEISDLVRRKNVDHVIFSYSDISHQELMEKGSLAMSAGANFGFLSPDQTSLQSKVPVIAVCAVRTGCGKSQTSRKVATLLQQMGKRGVAIRHPMPYGDLRKQIVQRFASYADLDQHNCTIEEREEYEPYLDRGHIVYAGIDYEKILREAEKEADVIIWDGGNNDFPFIKPNQLITVVDPLRAGHELRYFPGMINFVSADVIVINKSVEASYEQLQTIQNNIKKYNPDAQVIRGRSVVTLETEEDLRGKKVLAIEDGPSITHGEMSFGAGTVAAQQHGAELVDPRPYAIGSIKEAFYKYPQIGNCLPALGYYPEQLKDLEKSINATPCDVVLVASPIDIRRVIKIKRPAIRVNYELEEDGHPTLEEILKKD